MLRRELQLEMFRAHEINSKATDALRRQQLTSFASLYGIQVILFRVSSR